jgi:hypothetical protein
MTPEQDQIELVRSYLDRMRAMVRAFGIYTRNTAPYLGDHVVFGLLSKAFSLSDAAMVLIANEHPDEAFGLARSLVECAANLRYITQDRNEFSARALAFAEFFFKERQFWLFHAKDFISDPAILAELDKYADENGIIPNSKPASAHWSGIKGFVWAVCNMSHPLDGAAYELRHRKIEFATEYHQTSAFVHCSFPAIDTLVPEEGVVYEPRFKSEGKEQEGQKTLYTIVQFVHYAVHYTLYAMRVEDASPVEDLFRDTLSQLHPIQRLHRP